MRPNEPLIEDVIAVKYGTSRTPLREAIQRLAAEGLLVPRRRGWAVREFTPDEIRQNYEVGDPMSYYTDGEGDTPKDEQ